MSKADYNREPSEELLALLKPGRILAALTDKELRASKPDVSLDIHFRPKDEIQVYCGLTRVMQFKRLGSGKLRVSAHSTYKKQACGGFLRERDTDDPLSFSRELHDYLDQVCVGKSHVEGEGSVQLKWSRVGPDPWIPFDREVRLENGERGRCKELDDAFSKLKKIHQDHSDKRGRERWSEPKMKAKKLDQLAVDQQGRLVLIELKSGKTRDYYASFQLLQYVWEWHNALRSSPELLKQLKKLLDARVQVGLTSKPKAPPTAHIRAVVGLGRDERNEGVKHRHRKVLEIVNSHLPSGVDPIETWEFGEKGPQPIRDND